MSAKLPQNSTNNNKICEIKSCESNTTNTGTKPKKVTISVSKEDNKALPMCTTAPHLNEFCPNIDLLAIQNEREYFAIVDEQRKLLEAAKAEKIQQVKRKEEMYQQQFGLRKKFIETNDFIRQCENREAEAEKQIQNQLNMQDEIRKEIENYKKDIKDLDEFKKVLQETVSEMEPYETVINDVVNELEIVKTPKECMDRCDALMLAQDEITELEKAKVKAIDQMRIQMVEATNEASSTLLGLNNELGQLEHLYSSARAESMKWEKILAETKNMIVSNELKSSLCIDSIFQMYSLLCKRNGWDYTHDKNKVEKQLDVIKNEIEILQKVVEICETNKPDNLLSLCK